MGGAMETMINECKFRVGERWKDREGNILRIDSVDDGIDDTLDWYNIRASLLTKAENSTLFKDVLYYETFTGKSALIGNVEGKWDLVERL